MTTPVVTIESGAYMHMAKDLLDKHNIHSLPVIRDDKVVGILTDRDLKRASASDATSLDRYELAYLLQRIKIAQIMTDDPITIRDNMTLAEAADIFLREKVSVLPVMNVEDHLVGIITPSDISRAFLSLTANDKQGTQLGLQVEDRPGITMDIANCIGSAGGRIASLISTDSHVLDGYRQVYIRIYGISRWKLVNLVAEIRKLGLLLYIVDHDYNHREIYAAA
jgi:acetoin utilization protein AcuB